MTNKIETREQLFTLVGTGAVVITPNNRLANQLIQDFFFLHPVSVQDKPDCLPYSAFLHKIYKTLRHHHSHIPHPIVLTSQQQQLLWRQILKASEEQINSEGLLQEVQEAWARCQNWQIPVDHPAFSHNLQTQQFQLWQQQFQRQLEARGAITEEQLVNYVLPYADKFDLKTVIWACFDDYTPQQRNFQQTLLTQGCTQYFYDLAEKPLTTQQYAAKDSQDELLQMLSWLKLRLAAGEQRIGVIVPDLQTQSRRLKRLLLNHLAQDQFNLSLGEPLAQHPLVAHALHWLSLEKKIISNHLTRLLLYSPYLAGAKTELPARAQLMQDSYILQEEIIPFPTLLKECNRSLPILSERLNHLLEYPQQASPYEWINHFKTRLKQLGFPGDYSLNSSTYQYFQRFIALLDEFLQFTIIMPLMTKEQALESLEHLAKTTIFQIRKSTSPIQILGLLEASGCQFDSVWVCGLTDQCLPQKTNLSPFIPLALQRDRAMPKALPARELQFAKQVLSRLQHGSQHSVFSYPRMMGDTPNLPCPLINELPQFLPHDIPARYSSSLINQEENYNVSLTAKEIISGGTALLANQAKCPFRAFAAHRLHAKSGPEISSGPNASERGQLMHKVMDKLWRELGSQENLLSLTDERLNQLIEQAILNALTPFVNQRSYSLPALIQDVELSRLKSLVYACLEWEKQRPPFVVEALEQAFTLNLSGIDFHVRVDRLDQVEDKKWVIDYKSSLPISKPWYEERPEEPQLLLYALLDKTINTLLFLQLKAGRLTCSGLSEQPLSIKGIYPLKKEESWPVQQQLWEQQLSTLAGEFAQGHCPPDPTRKSTCQQCDFQNLCRMRAY